jgi:hypothetical protein
MEHEPPAEVNRVLAPFIRAGRVYRYSEENSLEKLLAWLDLYAPADVHVLPATPALRLRHVVKDQQHYYLVFNEERAPLDISLEMSTRVPWSWLDPASSRTEQISDNHPIHLDGYELKILIGYGVNRR